MSSLYMKLDIDIDILKELIFKVQFSNYWIYGEFDSVYSLKQNDIVNILGPLYKHMRIDRQNHYIIVDLTTIYAMNSMWIVVHPDLLITGTALSDAFSCMRRSIVSLLYPGKIANTLQNSDSRDELCFPESWIIGSLLHELFQACLGNDFSMEFIHSAIPNITRNHIESIAMDPRVNIKQFQLYELILSYAPSMIKWHNQYYSKHSNPISVNKVLDIEETIWSVKYGLKGKVDATLSVIKSPNKIIQVPFELKTGKRPSSVCHRAQTLLYALMLHSKQGKPFDLDSLNELVGLLFYLNKSSGSSVNMDIIGGKSQEILDILRTRNRLSSYLIHKGSKLPDMLPEERSFQCQNCYANSYCFALKNIESTAKPNADIEFFHFWNKFVTKEESIVHSERSELWRLCSEERKKLGRCMNKMKLSSCDPNEPKETLFGSFKAIFVYDYHDKFHLINDTQMFVFDPVILSIDTEQFSLCETTIMSIGYILSISSDQIVLNIDKQLVDTRSRYRIDKDEQLSGFGIQRSSLLSLLASSSLNPFENNCNIERVSRLIVQLEEPKWYDHTDKDLSFNISIFDQFIMEHPHLNQGQRLVLKRSLLAKDYHLIVGMPGAGKSTVIASLIELLVRCGKTILFCSYTHNAIDLVLSKVKSIQGEDIYWRIGSISHIGKEINPENCLVNALKNMNDKDDIIVKTRQIWRSRPVIACTALCVNQSVPIIQYRSHFDYCIIDEATQISVPTILPSLQISSTWIMVGDGNQLPPISRSIPATLERDLDIEQTDESMSIKSLFSILSDKWKESISKLTYQYRMNETIMQLSNHLVYNNEMKCGNNAIYNEKIPFAISDSCGSFDRFILSNELIFVDCSHLESSFQATINKGEVKCISYILDLIDRSGYRCGNPDDHRITILSPYRSQVKLLSLALNSNVHISTIDKYQGKESDIVIISFVKSNGNESVGNLLKLWQRINVAITRAKRQLIMVGSDKTLSSNDFLSKMIKYCKDNDHFISMPLEIESICNIDTFNDYK